MSEGHDQIESTATIRKSLADVLSSYPMVSTSGLRAYIVHPVNVLNTQFVANMLNQICFTGSVYIKYKNVFVTTKQ